MHGFQWQFLPKFRNIFTPVRQLAPPLSEGAPLPPNLWICPHYFQRLLKKWTVLTLIRKENAVLQELEEVEFIQYLICSCQQIGVDWHAKRLASLKSSERYLTWRLLSCDRWAFFTILKLLFISVKWLRSSDLLLIVEVSIIPWIFLK